MKSFVIKTALCMTACLGMTLAHADVTDFAGEVGDTLESIFESPLSTGVTGINEGLRTLKDTTTVKGKVDTRVDAKDITQIIAGGEENLNELNLGSVSGGSFIDGSFTSDVTVGDITQSIQGSKNRNRANIGSVTD